MMTVLLWVAGIFVGYRIARVVFAPVARQWRERPVVIWDDYDNRWRAARRLRTVDRDRWFWRGDADGR